MPSKNIANFALALVFLQIVLPNSNQHYNNNKHYQNNFLCKIIANNNGNYFTQNYTRNIHYKYHN